MMTIQPDLYEVRKLMLQVLKKAKGFTDRGEALELSELFGSIEEMARILDVQVEDECQESGT